MKKSLLTIFALAIAIGPVLGEDEQDAVKQPKSRDKVAPAPTKRVNPPPPRPRPVQQPPKVQANVQSNANLQPRFRNKTLPPSNRTYTPNVQAPTRTFNPPDPDVVRQPKVRSDVDTSNTNWRNRTRNTPPTVVTPPSPNTTVQPN